MNFKDWLVKTEGLFMPDDKAQEGKSRRKKTAAEMRGTATNAGGIAGGPGGFKPSM